MLLEIFYVHGFHIFPNNSWGNKVYHTSGAWSTSHYGSCTTAENHHFAVIAALQITTLFDWVHQNAAPGWSLLSMISLLKAASTFAKAHTRLTSAWFSRTLQMISTVLRIPIAVMDLSSDCSDAFESSTFANVWACHSHVKCILSFCQ